MEPAAVAGAIALGFAAGMSSGLLGVGGGVLFVPALVIFLDQSQLEAQATSLLAVVVVAAVGVWRQREYGNVRVKEGLLVGILAPAGVVVGTVVANVVPERALAIAFAAVQLYFAWRLGSRAMSGDEKR